METYTTGQAPAITWNYKGTLAEIRAVPGPEGSLGHPTDSRLELRYRNGQWEALENGLVNLDTGGEIVEGTVRTIIRGQSVRSDGNLFLLGPGAAFANVVAETDCYTAPVAGLVDGAYLTDSADEGIPPIIRAGFLIPSGTEKAQKLILDVSCGVSFAASTLSASSLASKLTIKAYLINLSTGSRVEIASIDARAAQVANADPSTSLPCDFFGTIAPSSLGSVTTWNTRNHDYVLVASGNYGAQFAGFKEKNAYPQIDWGVDQGLIFTQQWDGGYPAGTFYFNQVSVKRG